MFLCCDRGVCRAGWSYLVEKLDLVVDWTETEKLTPCGNFHISHQQYDYKFAP